jgi:preprotein translocase subunit SecG
MDFLLIAQIILAIALISILVLQAGSSGVFGGSTSIYHTKRGMEKTLFQMTIVLTSLFVITCLLNLIL